MPRSTRTTLVAQATENLVKGSHHAPPMKRTKALLTATAALVDVWALAFAADELGHWPSQTEYAEARCISGRSAQRHWERFRQAFPAEDGPERIGKLVWAEMKGKGLESGHAVFSMPVDATGV